MTVAQTVQTVSDRSIPDLNGIPPAMWIRLESESRVSLYHPVWTFDKVPRAVVSTGRLLATDGIPGSVTQVNVASVTRRTWIGYHCNRLLSIGPTGEVKLLLLARTLNLNASPTVGALSVIGRLWNRSKKTRRRNSVNKLPIEVAIATIWFFCINSDVSFWPARVVIPQMTLLWIFRRQRRRRCYFCCRCFCCWNSCFFRCRAFFCCRCRVALRLPFEFLLV